MKNLLNNQYVRLFIFFTVVITLALLIVHFGNENVLNARRGYLSQATDCFEVGIRVDLLPHLNNLASLFVVWHNGSQYVANMRVYSSCGSNPPDYLILKNIIMGFQIEDVDHGTFIHSDNMILVDYNYNNSQPIYTTGINEELISTVDKDTVGVWKIKGHKYKFPFDTFKNTKLKAYKKFSVF